MLSWPGAASIEEWLSWPGCVEEFNVHCCCSTATVALNYYLSSTIKPSWSRITIWCFSLLSELKGWIFSINVLVWNLKSVLCLSNFGCLLCCCIHKERPCFFMRIFWINVLQLQDCFRDLHWQMYASYISDNIKCVWGELKDIRFYALSASVFVCRHTWLIRPDTLAQRRWKTWPPHVRYSNHSKQINSDTKTKSADKRVIMKINKDNEAQSLQIL